MGPQAGNDAIRDRLDRDVEAWRAEHAVPGVAMAVVGPGDRRVVLVQGVADAASGAPVRADHRFQVGSISKVVTALAVLRAVDDGAVGLEDPVVRHVPWFRAGPWTREITVHHLLCHTAGLPAGPDWGDASAFDVWALRDLDTMRPGDRYWYSNVGYKALSVVLGGAFPGDPPELVEREVLRPLGLAAAAGRVGATDPARDATGHEPEPGRYPRSLAPRVRAPEVEGTMGDGNVLASVEDMATLAAGLLRLHAGRGSLVSGAMARALFAPHARISRTNGYGYGLGIETVRGRTRFGHAGDMVGFRCSLVADPAADTAVVVLTNLRGAPTRAIARHALDVASAADPDAVPALALRPAIDPAIAGRYADADGAVRLRATNEDAALAIDGAEWPLRPLDDATFEVLEPAAGRHRLSVVPATRGRGPALAFGARLLRRDADGSGPAWTGRRPTRIDAIAGTYRSLSDPWTRSAELLVRHGRLRLVDDEGTDTELVRVARDRFRIGAEPNPERAVLDAWADGHPLRVTVSGRALVRDA